MKIFIHNLVAKYSNNSNGTIKMQWQYNVNISVTTVTKFVHEFRAATLECNAGQYAVELLLTPFPKSYQIC